MIMWIESGRSIILRYEDLWRDPALTLSQVTSKIRPVGSDRIETAIDLCDMNAGSALDTAVSSCTYYS